MAGRQLVCLSLIHPPQYQLFSQIHEILWRAFLPQMQLLGSSVEDPQTVYPSSEPKQIVRQIRQVAGHKMIKMSDFMVESQNVATEYMKLLSALPDVKESSKMVDDVCIFASGSARCTRVMQQHFIKVREELDSGLRRITVVFADVNQDTPTEITVSISKLFSAIDELNELFQECLDYFEETKKQTSDTTLLESNPPSPEETQMMREKWSMFWESLEELLRGWQEFSDLIQGRQIIRDGNIRFTPEALREASPPRIPDVEARIFSDILQNATRHTDHSEGSASGARPATIPPDPLSTKAKAPFWRRVFRCWKRVNRNGIDNHRDRDGSAPSPSNTSPAHKSKVSFWQKLIRYLRRNNSRRTTTESEVPTHPDMAAAATSHIGSNSQTEMNNAVSSTLTAT